MNQRIDAAYDLDFFHFDFVWLGIWADRLEIVSEYIFIHDRGNDGPRNGSNPIHLKSERNLSTLEALGFIG